jgi:uncharacterized cupredoxin-like copper-binding protein
MLPRRTMRHLPVRALVPALAVVVLAALAVGTAAARTHRPATNAATLSVTATDFRFKIIPSAGLRAGQTATFVVKNRGGEAHDFKIAGKKTRVLLPGQSARLNVKFTRAGKYQYFCTVGRHYQLGMKGTYTVRAAQ